MHWYQGMIRSLQCFLTKLLATCMNIMLMILHCTDFHRSQKTKVMPWPTCMGYCGQNRSFRLHIILIVHFLLMVLIVLVLLTESWPPGHIAKIKILWGHWPYSYRQYAGYRVYQASKQQRISPFPFKKKLRGSNWQDFVFIRPPLHFTLGLWASNGQRLVLQSSALVLGRVEKW